MERFLRYSLTHNRPIRLMLMTAEGQLRQVKAVVEALNGDSVSLYILRPPQRLTVQTEQLLAADYVHGDEGQD